MDFSAMAGALGPMQEGLRKAEAERASARFEGSAGGGAVKIRLTGALQVAGVTIAPAVAGDAGMLEDLVLAAVNDALRQHRVKFGATVEEQIGKLIGGTGISPLLGPLLAGLGKR